jgi:hypothetical protein
MYSVLPKPDRHWLLRGLAAVAFVVWSLVSLGVGPFVDVRGALDRAYPDSAVRGFLEQAPRGGGQAFVEPALRRQPETALALKTYSPEAFVGEFRQIGQRSAEAIEVNVRRVSVESALDDRATVVASAGYTPLRRERNASYTFFERELEGRFDMVRKDGEWYLASVPPFAAR